MFPENLYRVFHKGVKGKRTLYSVDTFMDSIVPIIEKDPNVDYYESIYMYNQDGFEQLRKTKSLAGIKGIKTDRLVWDFDNKDNVELALQDARELVQRISEYFYAENIRTFFSGKKGFHVEVHLTELLNRKDFEKYVFYFTTGLKTFDIKVKDEQRLFRFPLTKNIETQLYKIPLTNDEFFENTVDEIKSLAEDINIDWDKRMSLMDSYGISGIADDLKTLVETDVDAPEKTVDRDIILGDSPNLSNRPKHLTPAKFVLQEGFFEEGERNEACMILASTYKYLGYSKDHTYNIIRATLRLRANRLGLDEYDKVELWNTIIEPIYSPSWKGGTFSEEDGLLKLTIDRYNLKEGRDDKPSVLIHEVSNRFIEFVSNIDSNTIKTGIEEIDNNVLITTGMMVGYLGAPSSGKTTDVISILQHQSVNNIGAYFVSADMPDNLLFIRLLQRYCGMDMKKILEDIKYDPTNPAKWSKTLQNAWEQVRYDFRNVGFSFQSGPTVELIENKIKDHEQKTGNKIKVVAVDYLEKVRSHISDATAATGYNAARLADMTRDNDLATLLLLQPQKSAGDPSDALLSMRKVKGASVIEQDCRVIMTKWRPGFNPDSEGINLDDKFSSIAVVKNNMGPTLRMNFHWDGVSGRMRSLNYDELDELKEVEKRAYDRKNASKKDDNLY